MSVSDQIIAIIDALCEKLGIVIDWSADNIVPYLNILCEKFINYEIYTSLFWIAFWFVVCGISWTVFGISFSMSKKIKFNEDEPSTIVFIVFAIVSATITLLALIFVPIEIYDIIVAKTFPEKIILDYIQRHIQ